MLVWRCCWICYVRSIWALRRYNGMYFHAWRSQEGKGQEGNADAHSEQERRFSRWGTYFAVLADQTNVQKVAEGMVPSMHAIYNVINKKSEDGWRNGLSRSRSIFRSQIIGRFPRKQQRCCSKGLNRDCVLGAAKRLALAQKAT